MSARVALAGSSVQPACKHTPPTTVSHTASPRFACPTKLQSQHLGQAPASLGAALPCSIRTTARSATIMSAAVASNGATTTSTQAPQQQQQQAPTVSLLGVGLMGNKIARRLASQGITVSAWNRNPAKCDTLPEAGVRVCGSVAEAVSSSEVVLLTLADAATIREVLLQPSVRPLLRGKTVLQMGTIGPKESQALAGEVAACGGAYIEAPVLGSQPEAEKGTLLVMVGCASDPRDTCVWPLLCALGQAPNHIGPVGTAAATKLALNKLIATLTVGFATALGMVQRSGAPVDKFMAILRASALYAPTYDKKLQKMLDRDFGAANFPTKHLHKDVVLFAAEARAAGLDTRLLDALQGVTQDTLDRGLADTDYSAVYEAVLFPKQAPAAAGSASSVAGGDAQVEQATVKEAVAAAAGKH